MELDDVSAILSINVRTGEGELIERHNVHNKLSKYANELNMREDHLKNKEKEVLEVKRRKAKDMTNLLKNQDSLIKLTGARTYLFWLQGLKRLGSLIPDMGGVSDMRLIMMIKSSITNEEDKKAIANMGTVAATTNHISAKYMNAQTLIKRNIT
jgi:hypothetical protein